MTNPVQSPLGKIKHTRGSRSRSKFKMSHLKKTTRRANWPTASTVLLAANPASHGRHRPAPQPLAAHPVRRPQRPRCRRGGQPHARGADHRRRRWDRAGRGGEIRSGGVPHRARTARCRPEPVADGRRRFQGLSRGLRAEPAGRRGARHHDVRRETESTCAAT